MWGANPERDNDWLKNVFDTNHKLASPYKSRRILWRIFIKKQNGNASIASANNKEVVIYGKTPFEMLTERLQ